MVYVRFAGVWLLIVSIIGFGKRLLDTPSPALAYLGPASYPLYILHQTVIVAIGFYLVKIAPWPALGWPLLMLLSAVSTVAAYEGVRRIRPLRFSFGIKQARPPAADADVTPATP